MTAKTEPCECDERQCTGVKPRAQEAYQPQLFAGSDVEVLDSDSWCTPEGAPGHFGLEHVRAFFRAIAEFYGCDPEPGDEIDLDPCSNKQSTVGARVSFTIADDGLSQPWVLDLVKLDGMWSYETPRALANRTPTRIWVNHPYSTGEAAKWLRRCAECGDGAEVLAFPKGDWSTSWWQDHVRTATARCELSKRVAFVSKGKRSVANFPSVLVYWGKRPDLFSLHFREFGEVIFGRAPPGSEEPSADLPAAPGWTP